MEPLTERINRLELLTGEKDVLKEIQLLNGKLKQVYTRLPELHRLSGLGIPRISPESIEEHPHNINLIVSNYNEYKEVLRGLLEINSFDLNSINLVDIDLASVVTNRTRLLRLSEQYMESCVNSLLVVEKFIKFFTDQNDFLVDVNDQLTSISREVNRLD